MPLSTALYTAVSGLNADGAGLSVIGNDISNSNTVGFKGGVASFADILSSSLAGGSQIGRGVQLQQVMTDATQGTLQTTNNPLDLAIQGDGFFIVHTSATGGAQYYSRAGQFSLDKNGNVVDPNGNFLQGYLAGMGNALGTINVASLNSPPKQTGWKTGSGGGVTITANLNSATAVNDPTTQGNFAISGSNNAININGTTYYINIPANPYTGSQLATQLQDMLNGNSDYTNAAIMPGSTVTYNPPSGTNPYTFSINNAFVVDSYHNTINFTYSGTNYTATIVPKNYTSGAAFATAVTTALNGAGLAGNPFTVSYAANKFTITNNMGLSITINWSSSTATPQQFGDPAASSNTIAAAGSLVGTTNIVANPLTFNWNITNTSANMLGFNNGNFYINPNTNTINFTSNAGANSYLATIPAGNYTNGQDLASAIQSALNAATPQGAYPVFGSTFLVTYSAANNQLTITNNNSSLAVSMFAAAGSAIPAQFGFAAFPFTINPNGSSTSSSVPSDSLANYGTLTGDYQVAGFDPGNAAKTSDFSTSLTMYDSLGNGHLINVYFKKIAQNTNLIGASTPTSGNRWMWWAVTPASDSINGKDQIGAEGYLEFNTAGALVDVSNNQYKDFNFSGGVSQNQQITFDFGQVEQETISQNGSGLTGTTQYGSPNSVLFQSQDGYTSGSLQSLNVDQTGTMTGTFTNGQTSQVAQVALARFIAATKLAKQGTNLFSESSTSGGAIIGAPGTSGRGKIFSSSVEGSNVDLAGEFVSMITAQRGYEANAKVITVTSRLLETLGNVIST